MNIETNSNTPSNNSNGSLHYFVQPAILQQIGARRLAKLLDGFRDALEAANISLPTAPNQDHSTTNHQLSISPESTAESENGRYFDSLAPILGSAALPDSLRDTLLILETAAAPDNRDRLESTIQRRIPCVSLAGCCALDCALELWFLVPEELSQFQTNHQNEEGRAESGEGAAATIHESTDGTIQPGTNGSIHGSNNPPIQSAAPPCPNPSIHQTSNPPVQPAVRPSALGFDLRDVEPWPEPVDAKTLLDGLVQLLRRFAILPKWAAETLALWILHTFAFHLRDVTTYIGIESPEKRCGKTTLLGLLKELAHRAVASSNISPPAFFRVIEQFSPTLLIDEVDTFLTRNDQLQGILNAGYKRDTAFVFRAGSSPASNEETDTETSAAAATVKGYSSWCPKAMAKIGAFPDILADRCIIIRMQRKTRAEKCDRMRNVDGEDFKRKCARFVLDHAAEIAAAQPEIPESLNDRAADIWEPLLVLADLAGGDWPSLARQAAISLTASAQESSPIASLLLDIFIVFTEEKSDRVFTRTLLARLSQFADRPWAALIKGKEITDQWLAQQLRPYGVKPKNLRIGGQVLKGYLYDDFLEVFRRYLSKAEIDALIAEEPEPPPPQPPPDKNNSD
jgi:hypothetical protein